MIIICSFIMYMLWFCRNSFWCQIVVIFISCADWLSDTWMQNRSILWNWLIMQRYCWTSLIFHESSLCILLLLLLCCICLIIQFSSLLKLKLLLDWLMKENFCIVNVMLFIIWFSETENLLFSSAIHISFCYSSCLIFIITFWIICQNCKIMISWLWRYSICWSVNYCMLLSLLLLSMMYLLYISKLIIMLIRL